MRRRREPPRVRVPVAGACARARARARACARAGGRGCGDRDVRHGAQARRGIHLPVLCAALHPPSLGKPA
ncbi:hypothetical protein GCM10009724_19510 [Microbacterium lacticum]|nr:hypothetical protein GCM10009724_19510 [Microbacterium lacticum]